VLSKRGAEPPGRPPGCDLDEPTDRGVSAAHRRLSAPRPRPWARWGGELVQEGAYALVELDRHVRRPVVAHRGGEGGVGDEVGEEEGVVGDDHRLKGVTKR
jgi:hypothetical protein